MANNSFTKNYSDGTALTEAKLDIAYQSLKLDISNTTQMTQGGTAGQFLKCVTPGSAAQWAAVPTHTGPNTIRNLGLKCTAASGALVFTILTGAGATPSASDPVEISFSTAGTTSAIQADSSFTATKTFTLTASASLGTLNTSATLIYVYALKNGTSSSLLLGVSAKGDYDCGRVISSTSVSSSSDTAGALYATSALSVRARLLGTVTAARNSSIQWQTPTAVNLSSNSNKGLAISSGSGDFSTTSSSFVDITNLSLTITTSGRPVRVFTIPDTSITNGRNGFVCALGASYSLNSPANIQAVRGTVSVGIIAFQPSTINTAITVPPIFESIDFPPAGTYTYKLQLHNAASGTAYCRYARLIVYEI